MDNKKLKLKDAIVVSLLGVVGFIIGMFSSAITQMFGTYGVFVHVSIGSLLCAPIYFVMCHKIPKHGVVFTYYLLSGIIYSIMGFIPMLLIMIAAGLFGELCIGKRENFENDKKISISYVISQLIYALHGFFFILVFGVNGLVETFPNLFTTEKAQMIKDIYFNPHNLSIILLVEVVAAILGTILGRFIYNKFFNKNTKRKEVLY